jgi:hypothetical protein
LVEYHPARVGSRATISANAAWKPILDFTHESAKPAFVLIDFRHRRGEQTRQKESRRLNDWAPVHFKHRGARDLRLAKSFWYAPAVS